jgi:hypothetical protein
MGRSRDGIGLTACLVVALAARGDDSSVDADVTRLVPGLYSDDAAARKASLDALRRIGQPALLPLLRAADPDVSSRAFAAVVEAAREIDADQALAAVETSRSEWGAFGWTAKPGGAGPEVVDAMERILLEARKSKWSKPAPLTPAVLADGVGIPPWVDHRVGDALPKDLTRTDVRCRERKGCLEVDAAGDGAFATKVESDRAAVVVVGPRRVLVHRKLDGWYAACADLLRADVGKTPVEFLDGDADGAFDGPRDFVRFGDQPFRPVTESPFAWIGGALFRFRVVKEPAGPTVSVAPEPEPSWIDASSAGGVAALNEWRADFGLAPQRADRDRSRCCRLHHDYWKKAGLNHDLRDHDEDPAKPGYTEDGERAGHNASCGWNRNGAEFVKVIGASVLHRGSLLGRASEGVGMFVGPMGQLLWGGAMDGAARGVPTLIPAPGQTGVATTCCAEMPTPTIDPRFYDHPRGFPVLVAWTGNATQPNGKGARLEVFEHGASAPLAGVAFSPDAPYVPEHSEGFVAFVADAPLPKNATLTARFRGESASGPVEIVWQFRTK